MINVTKKKAQPQKNKKAGRETSPSVAENHNNQYISKTNKNRRERRRGESLQGTERKRFAKSGDIRTRRIV
jgi:hypothetical protein